MWLFEDLFTTDFTDNLQINILDVGAALKEYPIYQDLLDFGIAKLIGFEPNQEECAKLKASYGEPHQFFPYFIGDGQSATFYETNWSLTGSLFEPNSALLDKFFNLGEVTRLINTYPIETKRIDDIPEIEDVDFFKIDVQGSELSVFQNAQRILSGTLIICTEVEFVELYKKQPLFADVDTFLRHQGFQFHSFVGIGSRNFKPLSKGDRNSGNQALWADAYYVKDWMQLEQIPLHKLKKYAVIAHEILQASDLAHVILTCIDQITNQNLAELYSNLICKPANK